MFSQLSTISLPNWLSFSLQNWFSTKENEVSSGNIEVRNLIRLLKRRRVLSFQLKREYLPHQKGVGINYQLSDAPFLTLFSDQTFVSYNAFKEQVGSWQIDADDKELHMVYNAPLRGMDGELSSHHVFKIDGFDGQRLQMTWENPLGNVERTYFLVQEG